MASPNSHEALVRNRSMRWLLVLVDLNFLITTDAAGSFFAWQRLTRRPMGTMRSRQLNEIAASRYPGSALRRLEAIDPPIVWI